MIIQMHEVPAEGREWNLDQSHKELSTTLRDLLGPQKFTVQLILTPISPGTYQLRGSLQTQVDEQCSRCGDDFNLTLNEKFQHILMPRLELARDAKVAKTNHYSDLHEESNADSDAVSDTVEYEGNSFAAGEFLHELIALAIPPIPAPAVDTQGNCTHCKLDVKNRSFSFSDQMEEPPHPFANLKSIKLN